jgi:hypothetical protein
VSTLGSLRLYSFNDIMIKKCGAVGGMRTRRQIKALGECQPQWHTVHQKSNTTSVEGGTYGKPATKHKVVIGIKPQTREVQS